MNARLAIFRLIAAAMVIGTVTFLLYLAWVLFDDAVEALAECFSRLFKAPAAPVDDAERAVTMRRVMGGR